MWELSSNFVEPFWEQAQKAQHNGDFSQMYTAVALRRLKESDRQNKRLIRYASYGFFFAGIISLLQGILNLDSEIAVNIIFVSLVLAVLLLIVYLRGKWLIELFIGSVRTLWWKIKYFVLKKQF